MVTPLQAYLAFVALFAAERLVELVVSTRNARRALARGAVESGRGHYPAMVVFHAAFLAACAGEALLVRRPPPAAALLAAGAALAAQGLRWWSVAALGERWSTRILVVPGATPVRRGPYRFLRHPNYVAVAVEMAALPLAYGSWRTALAATVANAALLAVRIPAEERALGPGWRVAFAETPRFVPRREETGRGDRAPAGPPAVEGRAPTRRSSP
jgi:methyltransferase